MFDKLTYKQKNYGLLVLFILMLMVSYKRSFVLTLNAGDEIKQQEKQKEQIKNAESSIELLEMSIRNLDKAIGESNLEPELITQNLLSEISFFSMKNPVHLHKIETTHSYQTVDFTIYSNVVSVEGSFHGITSLIYYLENHFKYARFQLSVSSLLF